MSQKSKKHIFSSFSIVEVFGGTFALLVVLFVVLNLISEAKLQQRLAKTIEQGSYKISWENEGEGYVIIAFNEHLFIVEQGKKVAQADICNPDGAFVPYVKNIYQSQKKQLIFAIVESGTLSMRLGRDCMRKILPNKYLSIAWIIANQELLKSVSINQFPAYIKKAIQ
jgi:hypothetical protein